MKLTDQQKIDIVQKYESGKSSVELSKEYNVTRQSILSILRSRNIHIRNKRS